MSIWNGRGGFYYATLSSAPTIDGEACEVVSQVEVRQLEDAPADVRELAQSYLDKADEDWTFVDPEDVKRLARAVLESGR